MKNDEIGLGLKPSVTSGTSKFKKKGNPWWNSTVRMLIYKEKITIKATVFYSKVENGFVCLFVRPVDKNTGVEAIWPSYVRHSRKFLLFEEFITVFQDLKYQVE